MTGNCKPVSEGDGGGRGGSRGDGGGEGGIEGNQTARDCRLVCGCAYGALLHNLRTGV